MMHYSTKLHDLQDSQSLMYTHFLPVIQSSTNLGAAVKGFVDVIKFPNQLTLR